MQLHKLSTTEAVLEFGADAWADFDMLCRRLQDEFEFACEPVPGRADVFRLRHGAVLLEAHSSPTSGYWLNAACAPAVELVEFAAATLRREAAKRELHARCRAAALRDAELAVH